MEFTINSRAVSKAQFAAARRNARALFRDAVAGADTSWRMPPATTTEMIASCQPRAFARAAEREAASSWAATASLFA